MEEKTLLNDIRNEHPRLIALESDTERIKKLIQVNPQAKTIYEALKREADKILDQPPVEYELIGPRLLHISRRCLHRIFTLATLYRLDGDSIYLERAKKVAVSDSTIPRSLNTYHLQPLRSYLKTIYTKARHNGKCKVDVYGKKFKLACVDGSLFGKFYGCVLQY